MLAFKNNEISTVVNFLQDLPLKGKASRGRTKIIKVLYSKYEEMQKDLEEIKKDLPEEPNESNESDEYQTLVEQHNREFDEIINEEVLCDISEYQNYLESLIEGLENGDTTFNGQDAVVYDLLLDKLEKENEAC